MGIRVQLSPGRLAGPVPSEHQVILDWGAETCSFQSLDTCSPRPPGCFFIKALLDQQLLVGSPRRSGRTGCMQLLRRHDNKRWR